MTAMPQISVPEADSPEQIEALFDVACARAGLSRDRSELSTAAFRRPDAPGRHQGRLFG